MVASDKWSMHVNHRIRHSDVFLVSLNTLVPILVGGMIYLGWRNDSLYMFHWLRHAGLNQSISSFRVTLDPIRRYLPPFVLYSLPDAAWVYSCSFLMIWLWKDSSTARLCLWGSIGAILGVGGELGQLCGIIPGTYDPADLIGCTLAVVVAVLVVKSVEAKKWTPMIRKL